MCGSDDESIGHHCSGNSNGNKNTIYVVQIGCSTERVREGRREGGMEGGREGGREGWREGGWEAGSCRKWGLIRCDAEFYNRKVKSLERLKH